MLLKRYSEHYNELRKKRIEKETDWEPRELSSGKNSLFSPFAVGFTPKHVQTHEMVSEQLRFFNLTFIPKFTPWPARTRGRG